MCDRLAMKSIKSIILRLSIFTVIVRENVSNTEQKNDLE